jgi:hypothetical protein
MGIFFATIIRSVVLEAVGIGLAFLDNNNISKPFSINIFSSHSAS